MEKMRQLGQRISFVGYCFDRQRNLRGRGVSVERIMLGFIVLVCFSIWYSTKLIVGLIESIFRKLVKIKEEIEEDKYELDAFIEEILHRLPASELHTLKTVCKNWYRIISSPYFVGLHLNRFNERRIRILMPKDEGVTIEYTNYCDKETQVEIRHPRAISRRIPIFLGSCDGLLCLLLCECGIDHRRAAIYNPSTGKYFIAKHCPDLGKGKYFSLSIFCSWFGYHPTCEEYVLVLGLNVLELNYLNSRNKVRVYKFSRCELKPIHPETCFLDSPVAGFEERGVLLHGAVHWPATDAAISVYHLDSNKHSEISMPHVSCYNPKVGVARGCLFVIFMSGAGSASVFEMWIMKEYGVQQSWTKYATIEGFNNSLVLSPLGFFPNGDIILDVDKLKVIRYSFNDNKAVTLMVHNHSIFFGEAIMCADSLVFPAIL